MAYHNNREEQQLIKLLKNLPFADESKADWVNRIDTDGMTEELVDEINTAFADAGAPNNEASDLMYHLLVLLAHGGAGLGDVEAELARRFGLSGLEEKASRRS